MQENSGTVKERRKFIRIAASTIVEFIPASGGIPPQHVTAETLDMSPGGILFTCDHEFDLGSRWNVQILLEESKNLNPGLRLSSIEFNEPVISAIGRVVRVQGADEIGFETALEFESIDKNHVEAVQQFLNEV